MSTIEITFICFLFYFRINDLQLYLTRVYIGLVLTKWKCSHFKKCFFVYIFSIIIAIVCNSIIDLTNNIS